MTHDHSVNITSPCLFTLVQLDYRHCKVVIYFKSLQDLVFHGYLPWFWCLRALLMFGVCQSLLSHFPGKSEKNDIHILEWTVKIFPPVRIMSFIQREPSCGRWRESLSDGTSCFMPVSCCLQMRSTAQPITCFLALKVCFRVTSPLVTGLRPVLGGQE